jgi:hypothetical protein
MLLMASCLTVSCALSGANLVISPRTHSGAAHTDVAQSSATDKIQRFMVFS